MANPMHDRQELCKSLQQDPLNLRRWTQLQQSYLEAGDNLSAKSVAVIVQGIAELNEILSKKESQLTNMQRHAFSRLAMSHNNSGLLKEIGIFYLHEFKLPGVAIQHLELAKRFRTSDGDLDALLANAKSARDRAGITGESAESGVVVAKHARPAAKEMLRRTGKLSFHKKTEGLPDMPAELARRTTSRKLKRPTVAQPPEAKSPARVGDATAQLQMAGDQRLEHEGEYLSVAQAVDRLPVLAQRSKFDSALTLLETIIETCPRLDLSWSAATQLGQECFALRQYTWAAAAFQHAANLLPDEMVSWFNLGLALQNLGELNEAMEVYERADQIEPGHPKVWCNMSALYFQSDRLDQAEDAARKSLQADPDYARSWDNLASALGAQGQLADAEEAARRAVAIRPGFAEPWLKLGMIYFQQDRLEESREAFGHAKELTELSAYALCYLAIIHTRQQRIEDANACAEEATRLDGSCEILWMAWNEVGMFHLQAHAYPAAQEAFGRAIECDPENHQCWFNRALAYQRGQELAEAERCYRESLKRKPGSQTAWRSMGHVARELKNDLEAAEAFAKLVELEPENPAAWSDYAGALAALGRDREADEARGRAREITSRNHAEASRLGRAFSYLRNRS
ncbi:MAG: tetratricopeptide repeat protein [Verrucomicrobiota bacterium]